MNYQTMFDICWGSSRDLFLTLSKKFLITGVNNATEQALHCHKTEILNKNISRFFRSIDVQPFPDSFSNFEKTQVISHFSSGNKKFKIVWEIIPLSEADLSADEPAFFMIGKIQLEMMEQQQKTLKIDDLISYAPGLFYWKDTSSVYQGCNDEFARLAGLTSRCEVIGKTDHDLHWRDRAAAYIDIDKKVIRTGKPDLEREEVIRIANGHTITALTNKVPLLDNSSQVIGVLGITVDITRQKEIENDLKEAHQKLDKENREKYTEFIANMSHDVKTPLSGIIGLTEVLKPRVSSSHREYIEDIHNSGKHLMAFFENCIELSKLENGAILLSKEIFALKPLLKELEVLFQSSVRAKGLSINIDYDEKIPSRFFASRVMLYRILLNLLSNAIKFTKEGSISIYAQLSQNNLPNQVILKLIIADTGIGIPKDKQQIIFERFSRLTPSYQGIYEGSGIGLYIVKQFVTAMSGEIHCKSEEGKGSQFMVVLPLQIPLLEESEYENEKDFFPSALPIFKSQSTAVSKPITQTSNKVNVMMSKPPKILLVEDHVVAQKATTSVLNICGYEVEIADCGKQAITLFESGKYAMVFLDIGLPDMKGYQVASEFRRIEENTSCKVPIFGLSAHAAQEEQQLSKDAGMDGMLSKPLLVEQATQLLQQYVTANTEELRKMHGASCVE